MFFFSFTRDVVSSRGWLPDPRGESGVRDAVSINSVALCLGREADGCLLVTSLSFLLVRFIVFPS